MQLESLLHQCIFWIVANFTAGRENDEGYSSSAILEGLRIPGDDLGENYRGRGLSHRGEVKKKKRVGKKAWSNHQLLEAFIRML